MARELCSIADVTELVPGYECDRATNALLEALIDSESADAHALCRREFVAIAGNATRRFDLTAGTEASRQVRIDDATSVSAVAIENQTQAVVEMVAVPNYVELAAPGRRTREEWEPITYLEFPPLSGSPATLLGPGYVLKVTGVWGWPQLPKNLRTAVARLVLVRYLDDAAAAGTELADALNDQRFNVATAFAASRETLRRFSRFPRST